MEKPISFLFTYLQTETRQTHMPFIIHPALGFMFSKQRVKQDKNKVLSARAHGEINYIFEPKGNNGWQLLTFVYTAEAAYEYLTIGNFNNDSDTRYKRRPSTPIIKLPGAYYFIDEVSVVPSSPEKPLKPDPVVEPEPTPEPEITKIEKSRNKRSYCGSGPNFMRHTIFSSFRCKGSFI